MVLSTPVKIDQPVKRLTFLKCLNVVLCARNQEKALFLNHENWTSSLREKLGKRMTIFEQKIKLFTGWSIFTGVERTIKTDHNISLDHWLGPLPAGQDQREPP